MAVLNVCEGRILPCAIARCTPETVGSDGALVLAEQEFGNKEGLAIQAAGATVPRWWIRDLLDNDPHPTPLLYVTPTVREAEATSLRKSSSKSEISFQCRCRGF
jgi:hypothetical protein